MQVQRVLVEITHGHQGYVLATRSNIYGQPRAALEEVYTGLVWTELVDVLLEILDTRRPGWEYSPLGHQPPLY